MRADREPALRSVATLRSWLEIARTETNLSFNCGTGTKKVARESAAKQDLGREPWALPLAVQLVESGSATSTARTHNVRRCLVARALEEDHG